VSYAGASRPHGNRGHRRPRVASAHSPTGQQLRRAGGLCGLRCEFLRTSVVKTPCIAQKQVWPARDETLPPTPCSTPLPPSDITVLERGSRQRLRSSRCGDRLRALSWGRPLWGKPTGLTRQRQGRSLTAGPGYRQGRFDLVLFTTPATPSSSRLPQRPGSHTPPWTFRFCASFKGSLRLLRGTAQACRQLPRCPGGESTTGQSRAKRQPRRPRRQF
jgi:hypothetical protein